MHDNLIEVRNVYKRFLFVDVLKGISFNISRDEHTLLLGPSSNGKSTLIKVLAGLLKPNRGSVKVLGVDPFKEYSKIIGKVNVLLDDYALPYWLSGYKYLEFITSVKSLDWNEVVELAKIFNVINYWHKPIFTYSSGMKKKVALIQVLAGNPKLILIDDPFTYLDRESREILIEILREKSRRSLLVVSTHTILGLKYICKKAILLDNGMKVAEGPIDKVVEMYS